MVVLRSPIAVVHIVGVVNANAGTTIIVARVMMTVVRVAIVTRVVHVQIMVCPANGKRGGHAPEIT